MGSLSDYYLILKTLHVGSVALTGAFFALRGVWMLLDSRHLRARWVRVTAPIVDTLLLLTAIGLMLIIEQYPGTHSWLTAKIVALFAYIGLGMVGLRYGATRPVRTVAWLGALLVLAYILAVALTRDPLPFV